MEKIAVRRYLLASHGSLASGIRDALELITGPAENLTVIDGYVDGNKSIDAELEAVLQQVAPKDELLVFTDLLGGSITNQVLRHTRQDNVFVVAGMNLPLLIEVVLADPELPAAEVVRIALENARAQIVDVKALLAAQTNAEADD